jgi:hypothetical protein
VAAISTGSGLRYRPPGQPHFGGVVQRVIGTMMQMVHELPGTTFSSTAERGGYNSDANAVLTLRELQRPASSSCSPARCCSTPGLPRVHGLVNGLG